MQYDTVLALVAGFALVGTLAGAAEFARRFLAWRRVRNARRKWLKDAAEWCDKQASGLAFVSKWWDLDNRGRLKLHTRTRRLSEIIA